MSRKKTRKQADLERPTTKRAPAGRNRADIVLSIVATDNTFVQVEEQWRFGPPIGHRPCWVGRCIHCNTKIFVTPDGSTDGTIEHIKPLCSGGHSTDPHNLALACVRCNNEKGIRHDRHVGKGGRADEVIASLQAKRDSRWR